MEESQEIVGKRVEKRKKKIKNWLKNPYNLIFIGILIFAIIIRLYYFTLTSNQPIWWDEADYLAYAKNLAGFNSDWIVTPQHNSIFPFIISLFFLFGFSEAATKFMLEIVPSILLVILTYFLVNLLYSDKRIALISSFLMATFWVVLFNSMRFHLGVPGLLVGLLAIYVFWQGYERKEKIFGKIDPKWAVPITIFLVVLTYTIRRGYFLFGFFFLFYVLSTRNWKDIIKDKYNWIGLGVFAVFFFIVEKFIFTSKIGGVAATYINTKNPITLLPFDVFKSYFIFGSFLSNLLFYLFWIGVAVLIFSVFLSFGHIRKIQRGKVRGDIFMLITIIITLAYFIFFLRAQNSFGEPRWYLPLVLGAFICISRGTLVIGNYIKKYNKVIAVILIITLIGVGGYSQIQQADSIIKNRAGSFEGLREASLYVKGISTEDDIIISQPVPQTIYYSERKVLQPEQLVGVEGKDYTFEEFLEKVRENTDVKYIFVSFSEPGHPEWMKQIRYQNGQISAWEIPFMDTKIDFSTGQQDIKQSKTYEDITFTLLNVKQDVFIYEIIRS
ncbi:MAG: hypothetical protein IIA87_02570 [Nanoarchaeota archaeon]|nr:hypothetical protein [Nanoarchaeota archaeon]